MKFTSKIIFISILLVGCHAIPSLDEAQQSIEEERTFMDVTIPQKDEQIYQEAIEFYNEGLYPQAFYRFMHVREYQDSNTYMNSIYQKMARKTLNPQEDHLKFLDENGVERVTYYKTRPMSAQETGNRYYSYTNTKHIASAINLDHTLKFVDDDFPNGLTNIKSMIPKMQAWENISQFESSNGFFACVLDHNGEMKNTYGIDVMDYVESKMIVQVQCGKFEYLIALTDTGTAYQKYGDYMKGEGLDLTIHQNVALLPTGVHSLGLSNQGDLIRFEPDWSIDAKLEQDYYHLAWIFNTWNYSKYVLFIDGNGVLHMPGADDEFNQLLAAITDVVEANFFDREDVVVKKADGRIFRVLKERDKSLSITQLWGD